MNENLVPHQFQRYVDFVVGAGGYVSRSDVAHHFGVHYTTAKHHLERAVARGLIAKVPGYVDRQPGWVYCALGMQKSMWEVE